MRAIEEGRYLVRSANTGISGIVDPYGRVVERSSIFQQVVLVGEAPKSVLFVPLFTGGRAAVVALSQRDRPQGLCGDERAVRPADRRS